MKIMTQNGFFVALGLLTSGVTGLTYQTLAAHQAKPAAADHNVAPPEGAPTPQELNADTFFQVRNQIKPQSGESRWLEIPWQIDLHVARKKAAAEGRPLFVMSGGGATAIGTC